MGSGKMQEDGPDLRYSPASLPCSIVSDHCLMLSIFPIPLKHMPHAQFLRTARPLSLALESPVYDPFLFLK